eukprot:18651-Amphidinium_carterae.1
MGSSSSAYCFPLVCSLLGNASPKAVAELDAKAPCYISRYSFSVCLVLIRHIVWRRATLIEDHIAEDEERVEHMRLTM